MTPGLQTCLMAASIAVVVFVICFIPIFILMCWHLARVSRQIEELKSKVEVLVRDSQTMLQNINKLTDRGHAQMEELDKVVRTVGTWSVRANRIVEEVGDVIETPILTAPRFIAALHRVLSGFMDSRGKKDSKPELEDAEHRDKD